MGVHCFIHGTKCISRLFQFSSVTQSCPTLCDPMDCSTPGLPVHHQIPEFTQFMSIESVMPSNHLILCCPSLSLSTFRLHIFFLLTLSRLIPHFIFKSPSPSAPFFLGFEKRFHFLCCVFERSCSLQAFVDVVAAVWKPQGSFDAVGFPRKWTLR